MRRVFQILACVLVIVLIAGAAGVDIAAPVWGAPAGWASCAVTTDPVAGYRAPAVGAGFVDARFRRGPPSFLES